MKKILIVLAAAVIGLCSCSRHEADCIYTIEHGVVKNSSSIWSGTESATLIKEYEQASISFDAQYASDWEWKVTVKDDKYSKSDKKATEKFQTYVEKLTAFTKEWQAKFDACSDDSSALLKTTTLTLYRTSSTSKTLGTETFTVKFNEVD